jgi:hypothetical protein
MLGLDTVDSVAHVIQVALTPVFLLSGIASLLGRRPCAQQASTMAVSATLFECMPLLAATPPASLASCFWSLFLS